MLSFLATVALMQPPPPQVHETDGATPGAAPSPHATEVAEGWFDPALASRCAAAADRGLAWLRDRQLSSGAWVGYVGHKQMDNYQVLPAGLHPDAQREKGQGHLGVTAICGMAFLAGGHLPDRGVYKSVVKRAEDFVIGSAQQSGLLSAAGTRMYSHAFGTLFLAEVYGMAANERAKTTLEGAVNLIVDCQNGYGGWRYNAFDREPDLSVTVCQLQALRAARNIGIRVPARTIDRAMAYVDKSRVTRGYDTGLYYYKIYGRGRYEKSHEYAINAAAMTALASAGIYDDDLSDPVLSFLERAYDDVASGYYRDHFYYWYGNYYAGQAFYQFGGARLRAFFARLAEDLLAAQQPDGRWRNRVGPGDELGTAVACVLLQMPRQYLPIFQR